jgi:hypothetical protein
MSFGSFDRRVGRKAVWGRSVLGTACVLSIAILSGCGDVVRQGAGSSYLIITGMDAASGAEPNEFGSTLSSDVITLIDDSPTIFNDIGRARFVLGMKDPGGADNPLVPTSNNFITLNRYHVRFFRADGRNTPGVDVPYAFDGAFTLTVRGAEATSAFTIVRTHAKAEAPLAALGRNFTVISTIAEVTFYGSDQTGREVTVVGQIGVDFANFGDPS